MMHKLKKATAHVTIKTPENAEFNDYRSRLENLAINLKATSKALRDSERTWKEVCIKQQQFAETFAQRYPDKDDIREFSKESAEASQQLVKQFALKSEAQSAKHWQCDAVVQEYIEEIKALAVEYRPINRASTEVGMYQKKVADLRKLKNPSEAKMERNIEKLTEAKKVYEEILEKVVEHMKAVYRKRIIAFNAAYVAYWSSQLRAFDLLEESLHPIRELCKESECLADAE